MFNLKGIALVNVLFALTLLFVLSLTLVWWLNVAVFGLAMGWLVYLGLTLRSLR